MAARQPLFPNVPLKPEEKITARGGDDLVLAGLLSGPGAKYVDHRFTDKDGRPVDEENPRTYGTNFVAKPIDRFTFLDALEEAMGTDSFVVRATEWDSRRRGPLDLYGSCHENTQWVVKVLLGRDPSTGKEVPRNTLPPHVVMDRLIKGLQEEGGSGLSLEKAPAVAGRR
jgi:hypothetical protein